MKITENFQKFYKHKFIEKIFYKIFQKWYNSNKFLEFY